MTNLPLRLRNAIATSNTDLIRQLLDDGVNPDAVVSPDTKSLVGCAAEQGSPEILQLLISHGGSPGRADGAQAVPLNLAIRSRNALAKVDVLLKAGADPNEGAPIVEAARHATQAIAIVEKLLSHGAEVDRCGFGGWTALHMATSCYDPSLVKYLLERNANTSARLHDPVGDEHDDELDPLAEPKMTPLELANAHAHDARRGAVRFVLWKLDFQSSVCDVEAVVSSDAFLVKELADAIAAQLSADAHADSVAILTLPEFNDLRAEIFDDRSIRSDLLILADLKKIVAMLAGGKHDPSP